MDGLMSGLTIILVMLIFFIIVLAFIYWTMNMKAKRKAEEEEKSTNPTTTKIATQYTKKSIFKFMQFDKIEDNMIIQDNGQKFLMVIECEGVNYDLMSNVEKTAVEAGFVGFLNTLRYPIQLYTQTRTINIGDSIQNYKNRLASVKKQLDIKQKEYDKIIKDENEDEKLVEETRRELIRIKNLYEYGQDVIDNIQKTSQNKNVLRKHYYVVVPYYAAEIGTDLLSEEEKRNMIFSELYTRSQSLIAALFSCEMKCRILNSNELVELLYVAYNRDESDTYGMERALEANYNKLYSTAPDVLDKQMKALDKQIEEKARELAKDAIDQVRLQKQQKIKKKQDNLEELIQKMAENLLKENEKYIGKEITEKAIEKINKEEGGNTNEQKTKKRTRRVQSTK